MQWIAIIVMAGMMFLTFADVAGRYVFNKPINGAYELTEYAMAIVIGFGIAYCAVQKGHVTIDLITTRFPKRAQAIIDSVTGFICLGLSVLIVWKYIEFIPDIYHSGRESVILGIPYYPFVAIVTLGLLSLTVVLLTHFIEFIYKAVKH